MKKKTKQNAAFLSAITMALVATTTGVSLNSSTVYAEENDNEREFEVVDTIDSCVYSNVIEDKRQEIESTIRQIIAYQIEASNIEMNFEYNDIYSPGFVWAGSVVDFTYNDEYGFAIFKIDNNASVLMEIVLENVSPYYGKDGTYIYLSYGMYAILHDDGSVEQFNLNTMQQNRPQKMNNKDKDEDNYETEVKSYSFDWCKVRSREINGVYNGYRNSMSLAGKTNNCANVAGVIMLNYWNKVFNNKILCLSRPLGDITDSDDMSDYTAGRYMDIFYDYMNTNWFFGAGGTLPNQVINGFTILLNQKGYDVYATPLKYFYEMKEHINNNEPLFITSTDYFFADYVPLGDNDKRHVYNGMSITYRHYDRIVNAHTFVAYGYHYYETHYEAEGAMGVICLLKVANGWGGMSYFNVDDSNMKLCTAIRVEHKPTISRC